MNFDAAIAKVASFGPSVKVSDDDKLSLYALFKQARNGNANDKDAPSRFNIVASAKFRAWKALDGVSKEEAERRYVELVNRLDPSWKDEISSHVKLNGNSSSSTIVISPEAKLNGNHHQSAEIIANGKAVEENGTDQSFQTKPRTKSLDRNFTFTLKPNTPVLRLSNTLEKVLNTSNQKISTRPRGRSLDFAPNFLVTPWIPVEQVGETVKQLVLKKDDGIERTKSRRILDHFDGVGNARDLGGLPALTKDGKPGKIRSNIVFRAAQFNEASERDANWLLQELNLKTLLDFRSPDSRLEGHLSDHFHTVDLSISPDRIDLIESARTQRERIRVLLPLLTRPLVKSIVSKHGPSILKFRLLVLAVLERLVNFLRKFFAALPILENVSHYILEPLERIIYKRLIHVMRKGFVDAGLKTLYAELMLQGKQQLKSAFDIVTNPQHHPLAFHCSFGKDRTGITAAIVLHAAGVPRDVILEDFALSHTFVETERGQREWIANVQEMPELHDKKEEWARSPAEFLKYAFDQVEKEHGSLDQYISKELGISQEQIMKVREHLVEEEPK